MVPAKQQVMEVLSMLPDDCSVEDVMYQLYVRDRIARGLDDIDNGNMVSHEEAENRIKSRLDKWRASTGQTMP